MGQESEPGAGETPESAKPPRAEAPPQDVALLQRELADARQRGEELLARLQYLQADFENFRKRSEREIELVVRTANEGLVGRLLPVLDDLDAAAAHVRGRAGKGLEMLRGNLLKALQESGLEEIPAKGVAFDPYLHECVQQVADATGPDGVVREVVRKGYRFRTKVLRPAQVVVVKKPEERVEEKEGERNA